MKERAGRRQDGAGSNDDSWHVLGTMPEWTF
jgi:hypothetical protein